MAQGTYENESRLLQALRQGDEQAYYHLYKVHYPMVLHFVVNNNGSEEEAQDLYQEALSVVYEKITEDQLEINCALKTYIYAICKNKWLKYLTRQKRRLFQVEDFERVPQTLKKEIAKDRRERMMEILEKSLDELGQPCKTILEMFYFKFASMDAISQALGYTNAANAKNQKYKCLKRMKTIFNAYWSKIEGHYDE